MEIVFKLNTEKTSKSRSGIYEQINHKDIVNFGELKIDKEHFEIPNKMFLDLEIE